MKRLSVVRLSNMMTGINLLQFQSTWAGLKKKCEYGYEMALVFFPTLKHDSVSYRLLQLYRFLCLFTIVSRGVRLMIFPPGYSLSFCLSICLSVCLSLPLYFSLLYPYFPTVRKSTISHCTNKKQVTPKASHTMKGILVLHYFLSDLVLS